MVLRKLLPRYRLRAGKPSDAPALFAVHDRAVRVLGRRAYNDSQVESWAHGGGPEHYVEAMLDERETFVVATAAVAMGRCREIVGFCSYKENEVRALYVAPDWSRLGLGTALLKRAEAEIAAKGFGKVTIGASLVGLPFYETHGYVVLRHRHWRTRGGLMIPAAEMEKALREASVKGSNYAG